MEKFLENSMAALTACQCAPLLAKNQCEEYWYYVCTCTKKASIHPPDTSIPCAQSAPQRLTALMATYSIPRYAGQVFPFIQLSLFFSCLLKVLDKLRRQQTQIIKDVSSFLFKGKHTLVLAGDSRQSRPFPQPVHPC